MRRHKDCGTGALQKPCKQHQTITGPLAPHPSFAIQFSLPGLILSLCFQTHSDPFQTPDDPRLCNDPEEGSAHLVAVEIETQKGEVITRGYTINWASQVVLVVKNLPANAGDVRDSSSIPGSGRSPGGENGNSLQYFCLENPRDRGAW